MPPVSGMPGVNVCFSCGVVGPLGPICDACEEQTGAISARSEGNVVWCAVKAQFQCRSCGFPSPLDGVVVANGIECAQCGSYQQFDASVWREALPFAHEVGDLGGPSPEGRFPNPAIWIGDDNPHRGVGTTRTLESRKIQGITLDAAPGHPVCKKCRRTLDVRFEPGACVTSCAQCGSSARYLTPPELRDMGKVPIAIVAEEHRQGRVAATLQAGDTGVVAITCPQCGASLRAGDSTSMECTYCHTLLFIPMRARPKGRAQAKPIVFFVAFEGPSPLRNAIESGSAVLLDVKGKVKSFFSRGLSPIAGVELAPVKSGLDVKQVALTISLTALALGAGWVLFVLIGS